MSVEKMKLLRIRGPLERFDEIVSGCILGREFQPENALDVMQNVSTLKRMDMHNPYTDTLHRAASLADANGIALGYAPYSGLGDDADEAKEYFRRFEETVGKLRTEQEALEKDSTDDRTVLDQLRYIKGMGDIRDVSDFFRLEYARFRFGRMPRSVYDHFSHFLDNGRDFYFFPTSVERDYVYGAYLVPRRYEQRVDVLFASFRFERIYISDQVHGNPEEAEAELERKLNAEHARAAELEEERKRFVREEQGAFLARYSLLRHHSEVYDMRRYAVTADGSFFLYGWVPAAEAERFRADVLNYPSTYCQVYEPDVMESVTPPTKLKNRKVFKPFEPFIEMYGRPSYGEFDPTPLMTVIYTLLYGIMFGDVGQGILLSICGYLMWRFKKMWIGRVLVYTGIAGSLMGLAYGSVFGFEDILPFGFHVLESPANTNTALQFAVYIGVIIITLVMLINIIEGFKQKDYAKAVFGQNGIAGVVFFYGVLFVILPMFGYLDVSLPGWALALMLVVPLILVVLREPLGKLCAGDPDWKPESIGNFLLQNVFELIEVLLSYVTNTVSFMRVGIYVISHAAMMNIVFMLAGGAESPNMVVVVFGNLIVMALEGLLVAIQVLRLNFYEMFGRFYDGGGREFVPAAIDFTTVD